MSPAYTASYPGHWLSLTMSKMRCFRGPNVPYLDYDTLPFSQLQLHSLCFSPKYYAGQGSYQTSFTSQLLTSSITLVISIISAVPVTTPDSPTPPPGRRSPTNPQDIPRSCCTEIQWNAGPLPLALSSHCSFLKQRSVCGVTQTRGCRLLAKVESDPTCALFG